MEAFVINVLKEKAFDWLNDSKVGLIDWIIQGYVEPVLGYLRLEDFPICVV